MSLDSRLFFPATQRNKVKIGDLISQIIPKTGYILEIASGSGEHAIEFQKRFPEIIWQTSDPYYLHRNSIRSWINHESLEKIMPNPLDIDVENRPWPISNQLRSKIKMIICINMIHIAPWSCTKALFNESANLLNKEQILMLYGPFKIGGIHISETNHLFDKSLRAQNNNWGVRDLSEINKVAKNVGFKKAEVFEMPANNFSLLFRFEFK